MKKTISLETYIPLLTEKPAQFLNLHHRKGFLKHGYDADFVIWNPNEEFIVSENAIFHKHKVTPYLNRPLSGKVLQTFVNGNKVFEKNHFYHKNAGNTILAAMTHSENRKFKVQSIHRPRCRKAGRKSFVCH